MTHRPADRPRAPIPVDAFFVILFLVALGGRHTEGTVFSIGVIVFGLFLLAYCLGHIA